MSPRFARAALFACVGVVCGALASCSSDPRQGYTQAGVYDESLGPIAVPVFENDTYFHGLEVLLTDAVVKEIQRSTPWRVVQEGGRSRLTGRITDAQLRTLSTANVSGLVEDIAFEITSDWEWRKTGAAGSYSAPAQASGPAAARGAPIIGKKGFRAASEFVPAQGVGERIEVGQRQAVQELARDIVASMRDRW